VPLHKLVSATTEYSATNVCLFVYLFIYLFIYLFVGLSHLNKDYQLQTIYIYIYIYILTDNFVLCSRGQPRIAVSEFA
jgi:hypothetical protein